jgi:protein-tyrosine-phosphatase
MRHTLKRAATWLQHIPDRMLHRSRRRAAQRLAAQRLASPSPGRVLFICYGNICRSPYAAAAFEAALQDMPGISLTVASAGFVGPDRPSPPEAQGTAARRGVSLVSHRSALVTSRACEAELVVVMDAAQRSRLHHSFPATRGRVLVLGDLDPDPIATRTITDPWGGPADLFETTYDRIDRCVRVLVTAIAARGAAQPAVESTS